jgi:hypothetical protein
MLVGQTFSTTITGSGGAPPYTWTIASGQLPTGLALAATTGQLSGSPVAPGNYSYRFQLSDSAGGTANRDCATAVSTPVQITTTSLPYATTRAEYSATLAASGGAAPYTWSVAAGSLPPGVTLDASTGRIGGTPSQPGQYSFTLRATDSAGAQGDRAFAVEVSSALSIQNCPDPDLAVASQYRSTLTVAGGQPPYSWTQGGGILPGGLTIEATTGLISGAPASAGNYQFTINARDGAGAVATRTCSVSVSPELRIVSSELKAGAAGSPYDETLSATGGTAPYTWTVSGGSLPPGVAMNAATGQLRGVPTERGTFKFTARVTDAAGILTEAELTIAIVGGFTISTCPAPTGMVNTPYSSSISFVGAQAPVTWEIASGQLPGGVTLQANTGTISGTPASEGAFEFVIRGTDAQQSMGTRSCAITVAAEGVSIGGSELLPDAVLGQEYSTELTARGGRPPYQWSVVEGTLPDGISLVESGSLRGTPTAAGDFRLTLQVVDQDRMVTARAVRLRVLPAAAPELSFGDIPEIIGPAQQPRLQLSINAAYPVALRLRLSLAFTPDPGLVDDKSIQFITGGRTAELEIPANATEPVLPVPQFALQTGTVAGSIELRATLFAGDLEVTPSPAPVRTIRIDRTAPVITNIQLTRQSGGIQVVITGFSTTREVTSATFAFTTPAGTRLDPAQVVINTGDAARAWFSNPQSYDYGSQFTFVQPFTVTGVSISEVNVTLTNAQGTSQAVKATF